MGLRNNICGVLLCAEVAGRSQRPQIFDPSPYHPGTPSQPSASLLRVELLVVLERAESSFCCYQQGSPLQKLVPLLRVPSAVSAATAPTARPDMASLAAGGPHCISGVESSPSHAPALVEVVTSIFTKQGGSWGLQTSNYLSQPQSYKWQGRIWTWSDFKATTVAQLCLFPGQH